MSARLCSCAPKLRATPGWQFPVPRAGAGSACPWPNVPGWQCEQVMYVKPLPLVYTTRARFRMVDTWGRRNGRARVQHYARLTGRRRWHPNSRLVTASQGLAQGATDRCVTVLDARLPEWNAAVTPGVRGRALMGSEWSLISAGPSQIDSQCVKLALTRGAGQRLMAPTRMVSCAILPL